MRHRLAGKSGDLRHDLWIGILALFPALFLGGPVAGNVTSAPDETFALLKVTREIRVVPGAVITFEAVPSAEAPKRRAEILKAARDTHAKWEQVEEAKRDKAYALTEPEGVSVSTGATFATREEAEGKAAAETEKARRWAVVSFTDWEGRTKTEVLELSKVRARCDDLVQEYQKQSGCGSGGGSGHGVGIPPTVTRPGSGAPGAKPFFGHGGGAATSTPRVPRVQKEGGDFGSHELAEKALAAARK